MQEKTLVNRTAQTATVTDGDFEVPEGVVGAIFYLYVSAISGTTPSLTLSLQAKDPASGNYINVLNAAFPAVTSTGIKSLAVAPGIGATANASVNYPLPKTLQLTSTITGTTPSVTYTVGVTWLKNY